MAGKSQVLDMTGLRFHSLTVIARNGIYRDTKQAAWLCRCDCGKEVTIGGNSLRRGNSKTCGCGKKGGKVIHGKAKTPIYAVWCSMHARCSNPKTKSYYRYGGRGIQVCERWNDFQNFLADMGERPEGKTLERINNDAGYFPGNCRWATHREQSNNTRRNRIIETKLGKMTVAQASRLAGITVEAMQYRLRKGLTGDRLLTPGRNGRRLSTI